MNMTYNFKNIFQNKSRDNSDADLPLGRPM